MIEHPACAFKKVLQESCDSTMPCTTGYAGLSKKYLVVGFQQN
jgi:hypothetical protein